MAPHMDRLVLVDEIAGRTEADADQAIAMPETAMLAAIE